MHRSIENTKLYYRRRTARRAVSRNLINCCTTVGISCTTNPQQIRNIPSSKLRASRRDASTVDPQTRPSMSSVEDTIDLPRRNFPSPEFGTNFLTVWDTKTSASAERTARRAASVNCCTSVAAVPNTRGPIYKISYDLS